ncbi:MULTISPECIES: MarR family winged helix-turn-helix transcriptional regulator [Streptomyces]|uniref:MarR family transcriptional regulator n=2 Tax=Streptomyces rimosus subsp. rimosus TaxID=132474 RepID=L8EFB4_STRR1|nr:MULTISPECIES: MarR family transcriptional regulator [Streptomyces]KOG73412.1 MarR family transcriptional regulator [Kitasatospora aureofaciens]MYT42480.1 MarR family transcriptional regulator [Streptomyces sp. SID5471]KOT39647.1 MarR family transcriptional regulator [Streptomyces rimosus subsp. rimosus]KOT39921.1 MarR family transcriptional regulator [Streptomyces sp. NRRL WC-3701]KOT56618.1 MarR family transcriptional regulator [Streptomyces rimosus subsp. rimosus]
MTDHVDRVLAQWAEQAPDLDASPMAVVGRVKRLAHIIETELRAAYKSHDLDAAAFDVLATLRRSPPPHRLTPAALMHSSMVTSGAISQRLDRLEERGLITRTRRTHDARSFDVTLTEAGLELVDKALLDNVATQNRLLAGLTRTQRDRMAKDLRGLLESLGDIDRMR